MLTTTTRSSLYGRLSLLLFVSGFCSLIYQVAWFRLLRLVFGASTAANGAVVAIFMGGLGLGGFLIGRRAVRSANPMALYAKIEIAIALTAAASPLLSWAARAVYLQTGGVFTLGPMMGSVLRLVLATVIIGLCTTLMGGTLPAASQAIFRRDDDGRRGVAWLYGVNTLGAVTGALLATFVLIELVGIQQSLWLASLVNLLLGMAARQLSRNEFFSVSDSPSASKAPAVSKAPATSDSQPLSDSRSAAAGASFKGLSTQARWVLPIAGIVGFIFFLMEIVWYRMLAPVLGGSSFTFGLILAVALLGIGTGGLLYSIGPRRRPTMAALAATCALEALVLIVPYASGDLIPLIAIYTRSMAVVGFWGLVASWVVVVALVVLPASLVAGYQFPLLVALLGGEGKSEAQVGYEVGLTYAWNTWGAILGSLAGGFGFLPWLTAPTLWRWSAVALLVLALALALLTGRRPGHGPAATVAVVGALLALMLVPSAGPTAVWRHLPIGVGRVDAKFKDPNELRDFQNLARRGVLAEADGVESSVALVRDNDLGLIVNGKSDGSARGDAATNIMSGLIGSILHQEPKRVLIIGLGTGVTAGWMAKVDSVEQVDVVELEPAVVGFANDFAAVNNDVLNSPKVNIIYGDGREYVLTHAQTYDVIFSEPSNPYRVGVADLFSQDFYQAVVNRLSDDGIFLQWLQGYEVDPAVIQTVYATLGSVFPSIETWRVHVKDLLLVATRSELRHDLPTVRQRVELEPYRSALRRVWGVDGLAGLYSGFVGSNRLASILAAGAPFPVSTDDRPTIEFGFARSVGRLGIFDLDELLQLSQAFGGDKPALMIEGDSLDWSQVTDLRQARNTLASYLQGPTSKTGAAKRESNAPQGRVAIPRHQARVAYGRGELLNAAGLWAAQDSDAMCHLDRLLLAEVAAEQGNEMALQRAEELAADSPIEAAAIRARYHWRNGDGEAAVMALNEAFERLRKSPWVHIALMDRGFRLAKEIGIAQPELGERILDSLNQPFAVYLFEEVRLAIRLNLVGRLGFIEGCATAIESFEPHVLWNQRFLQARESCYRELQHPLAAVAAADVATFQSQAPSVFAIPIPASADSAPVQ